VSLRTNRVHWYSSQAVGVLKTHIFLFLQANDGGYSPWLRAKLLGYCRRFIMPKLVTRVSTAHPHDIVAIGKAILA